MKPILVKDQVRLSPARCFYLTVEGMYYRFTRSVITVVILSLAVAFLMYVSTYSIVSQSRIMAVRQELAQNRLLGEWLSRFSVADPPELITVNLAEGSEARLEEYRMWSSVAPDEFATAVEDAETLMAFVRYFGRMKEGTREVVLGSTDPHKLPADLANRLGYASFVDQLKRLSLDMPLGDEETLSAFVNVGFPRLSSFISRVRVGQKRTIGMVRNETRDRSMIEVLIEGAEETRSLLARAGYVIDENTFGQLSVQALLHADRQELAGLFHPHEAKVAVARLMGQKPATVNLVSVSTWITSRRRARSLREALAESLEHEDLPTADRVLAVAAFLQRNGRLQKVAGMAKDTEQYESLFAAITAMKWLILVSLMVCSVGIFNTMMMSVTERFTEIATMKCLGAMDGFVMLLFVFEAIIQGVVGSLAGVILGVLLAFLRGVASYGGLVFESTPLGAIAAVGGISFVVGVTLAAIAAVGPAWAAARLAPMEAMRVE